MARHKSQSCVEWRRFSGPLQVFRSLHALPDQVNTTQTRLHDLNGNVTSMPFHDQAAGMVVQAALTYDSRNQMEKQSSELFLAPGKKRFHESASTGLTIGRTWWRNIGI